MAQNLEDTNIDDIVDNEKDNDKSDALQQEVFQGKKVNGLLEDIYGSINEEHAEIKDLMENITSLVTDGEADEGMLGFIGPVLSDLLDVSVKNNEQYIKLAEVIQKYLKIDVKNKRIEAKKEDNTGDAQISLSQNDKEKLKEVKDKTNNIRETTDQIQKELDKKGLIDG